MIKNKKYYHVLFFSYALQQLQILDMTFLFLLLLKIKKKRKGTHTHIYGSIYNSFLGFFDQRSSVKTKRK